MISCGFNNWNIADLLHFEPNECLNSPKSQVFVAVLSGCGQIVLRWVTETSQPFYIVQIPNLNLCQALPGAH